MESDTIGIVLVSARIDNDFVIDPKRQQLIGNPDHDGEFMIELY